MVKIRLRNFNTVLYTNEHIQEVEYFYTIEDSVGLLKITLTIPEDADPVEQFIIHLKDIYRNLGTYIVYHTKFKYKFEISVDNIFSEYYLTKQKMWQNKKHKEGETMGCRKGGKKK